jgi:hypothetical protein
LELEVKAVGRLRCGRQAEAKGQRNGHRNAGTFQFGFLAPDPRGRRLGVEHRPLNFGASWEAPSIQERFMNALDQPSLEPWNKGKLVGQKSPLRLRDI